MDALKKFLTKKKTDKAFKSAGPGHKLTADSQAQQGHGSSKSPGHKSGGGRTAHRSSVPSGSSQSEEKRAAAQAALARLEKNKKPESDSEKLLASRQLAFIKEQAKKELEAEKKAKESHEAGSQQSTSDFGGHKGTREEAAPRVVDPATYAVSGVYFTCPLIGPEVLTREEIEESIKEFLLEQPDEEIGVTSCLLIYSCNKPLEKITNCVETLCKYLDNIIHNPEDPKYRRIRCSNKVFQEKVACTLGAVEFLRAAGFIKKLMKVDPTGIQEEEFWVFSPADDDNQFVANLTELRDTLKQTTPIRPELDRNLQVLMPAQVKMRKELPDEFYALSLEEIKREQKIKEELAERETTLRTKAMKERDELREQRLYRYGILRVRFPDGFTLQGTFKAREKLSNLYDFVAENLVSSDISFELVKSGGEAIVDKNATLAELKLPPASILNFKVDKAPPQLASGEISFLKPDILELVRHAE